MHVPRATALFTVGCDCRTRTRDCGTWGASLGEGEKMFVPEHRLWSAVILNTVQEWLSGPLGLSQPAEQYLFHDEKDFPWGCESAGMNPGRLRSRLVRMRKNDPGLSNQPASHGTLGSAPRRTS